MVEIPPDLLVVSDDDLAVVYPLVVPASYGQLDGFPASLIPLSEERLALTWVALTRPEWMVYVKPAIVTAWEARGVDLYDRAMANMREADAGRTWTHEKADAWGRLIWSFHVMRARLRAAAPAAAAVAVGVLLGVLVIDPNTPPPGGWAASDYLAAAIGGTLLFACVLSVVAVWPRRGLHVLWWATVALWLRLILPSMPTDVRSGMAVLRVFVFWTALALPLFATAVWRARPHTARGWRRAAVGAALWMRRWRSRCHIATSRRTSGFRANRTPGLAPSPG